MSNWDMKIGREKRKAVVSLNHFYFSSPVMPVKSISFTSTTTNEKLNIMTCCLHDENIILEKPILLLKLM